MVLCESKDTAELDSLCSWKWVKDIPVLYWSCHYPNMKLGNNQYNQFLRRNYLSEEFSYSFLTKRVKCLCRFSFEFTEFFLWVFCRWKCFLEKTRLLKKSNHIVAAAETSEPSTDIFKGWKCTQATGIFKFLLSSLNQPASGTAPCTPSLQFLAWGAAFLGLLE